MIKMMKYFFVFIIFITTANSSLSAQGIWTKKASLGNSEATVRSNGVGVTLNNNGYVLFGSFYGTVRAADGYKYDEINNKWISMANIPGGGRTNAVAFAVNGKIYSGAGYNGTYIGDFWEYDPANNAWTQKANTPGAGRAGAMGFTLNGKGYISSGGNSTGQTNDTWEYDHLLNSWTQKANWGTNGRGNSAGFVINNKFYAGTGSVNNIGNTSVDWWEYNPLMDAWTQKANFPGADRTGAAAFAVGQFGYLGTGQTGSTVLEKDFYRYDPSTNGWTQIADFPGIARVGATDFSTATKGYVGAGSDNTKNLSDFYVYDPQSGTWTQIADCGGQERYYGFAFAAGSQVYVGGGLGGLSDLKTYFWAFDTTANQWNKKASLPVMKKNGVAFSIGTKGYITLGATLNQYSKELWQYDINTNVFTQKAAFPGVGRKNAVATTALSKGFVGTGLDSAGHVLKDWWQYNPTTNTWVQKLNFPGVARHGASSFTVNDKCFVVAGQDSTGFTYFTDCWKFNPSGNQWVQQASLPGSGMASATGFSVQQFGYVVCGINGSAYSNSLYQFDPSTNSWKLKAPFGGTIRYGGAGAGLGDKGYFGTGMANYIFYQNPVNDWWEYTPDKITCAVNGNCFCSGAAISVNYNCTALTLNAGNQFKLFLSDSAGSFANQVKIGTLNSTAASGTISGLFPLAITGGNHYRVRVVSTNNALTGESSPTDFVVYTMPENTSATNITTGSATLQWDAVPCAISYTLQYKVTGALTWTLKTATVNSKILSGLVAGTDYTWRVKARCSANPDVFSRYTPEATFTTAVFREAGSTQLKNDQAKLEIYADPVLKQVTVSYEPASAFSTIAIYDMSGKLLVKKMVNSSNQKVILSLDTGELSKGMYMVAVTDGKQKLNGRFVKN